MCLKNILNKNNIFFNPTNLKKTFIYNLTKNKLYIYIMIYKKNNISG